MSRSAQVQLLRSRRSKVRIPKISDGKPQDLAQKGWIVCYQMSLFSRRQDFRPAGCGSRQCGRCPTTRSPAQRSSAHTAVAMARGFTTRSAVSPMSADSDQDRNLVRDWRREQNGAQEVRSLKLQKRIV